jgi:ketosteroid isomerase-like protein
MTTTAMDGAALIRRLFQLTEVGDVAGLRALVHDDLEAFWPQSGERLIGPDNAIAAQLATAVKPVPAGEPRIVGQGDTWVMMLPLRYGEDVYQYVGVFELRDDLIHRTTEYFGAPFPPQASRAAYVTMSD